ncbi:MAG: Dabb family protein [Clostridia bacterium]|nr:Dabb family protein [Clostridia bacterium]
MVKHVVLYKLIDGSEEGRKKVVDTLTSMRGKIDELVRIEAGSDFLNSDRSFDVALVCCFKDRDALRIYQTHPVHLPVKAFMKGAVERSVSVDFEIPNE